MNYDKKLKNLIRRAESEPDSLDAWRSLALALLRKEKINPLEEERIIEEFNNRIKENMGKKIDNSSLYAGSPMYFYCMYCEILVETLPENYYLSERLSPMPVMRSMNVNNI